MVTFNHTRGAGHALTTPIPIHPSNLDKVDPFFVNAENHDLHLMPGSPMIDAGNNSAPGLGVTDIDGKLPIQGAAVDIGADEVGDLDPVAPLPGVYANGSSAPLSLPQGSNLMIDVDLDAGNYAGEDADWWAVAATAGGWFSYQHPSGTWVYTGESPTELIVTHQGPLGDLAPSPIVNTTGLGPGQYTVYFGVDTIMNGILDLAETYYDHVVVNVQ